MRLIMNGSQLVDLTLALTSLDWWKQNGRAFLLLLSIAITIFSLVVVKTQTREQFIDNEALQYHHTQLMHQQTQLILEKGAFGSELQVMSVAKNQLNMVMPNSKQTVLIGNAE